MAEIFLNSGSCISKNSIFSLYLLTCMQLFTILSTLIAYCKRAVALLITAYPNGCRKFLDERSPLIAPKKIGYFSTLWLDIILDSLEEKLNYFFFFLQKKFSSTRISILPTPSIFLNFELSTDVWNILYI